MVLKAEAMVRMIVVKADAGILCVLDGMMKCFDRRIVITFRLTHPRARRVTDDSVLQLMRVTSSPGGAFERWLYQERATKV